MKLLRLLILALVVIALVGAIAGVGWIVVGGHRSSVTLADGTRIELLGTTVGQQAFTTEKPWHPFARKHLPRFAQKWIPAVSSMSCYSGSNSVTVYFAVTGPNGTMVTRTPWNGCRAVDRQGNRFPRHGGLCSSSGASGGTMLYGLILSSLPRREKTFVVELLGEKDVVVASFTVPNPVPGPFPEWTPEPVPQTRTNGPLTLTLKSLHTAGNPAYPYLEGDWSIESSDPLWKAAKPGRIEVSDATGNSGSFLAPTEPVGKLTTLVHRRGSTSFTDAEKIVVPNIRVPTTTGIHTVVSNRVVSGATLNFAVLAAPGRLVITNGFDPVVEPGPISFNGGGGSGSARGHSYQYWESVTPAVACSIKGLDSDDEVRLGVRNADGIVVKMDYVRTGNDDNGDRLFYWRTTYPIDTTTVSLEIVVSRPLKFEFMVDSKDIKPAKK